MAFTSDGQVFLRDVTKKDASPVEITPEDETFTDLAWGPTTATNTIAMVKRGDGASLADLETSLCFGRLTAQRMQTSCKPVSDNVLGRKLNWTPTARRCWRSASSRDGNEIGMLGYTTQEAVLGATRTTGRRRAS